MPAFRIEAALSDQTCKLSLHGDMDVAVVDDVVQIGTANLAKAGTRSLIIDMQDVTFIDATGLGALVRLRNLAAASNQNLQLARLPDRVKRLLEITGLNTVFDVPSPER